MKKTSDAIIVSVDYTHGEDNTVLIVGRQNENRGIDIINAFQGDEAWELYKKLTTVNKKEGKDDGGREEV